MMEIDEDENDEVVITSRRRERPRSQRIPGTRRYANAPAVIRKHTHTHTMQQYQPIKRQMD